MTRSPFPPTLHDVVLQDRFAAGRAAWEERGTHRVGSDGLVELAQRIPEPALLHLNHGRMPHHLALTLAGYLPA